jgi:hypothetical protein
MASVLLVLLSFVMSVGSISAQPALGCQTHCGGVEIPYPFGIGAGCAIDKSFEISCNKTIGGERPFISNVEVQNICVSHGKTWVLNRISTYCYNNSTRTMERDLWWLDFSRSPYRFSDVDNKLIVMGCNTLAYIYNRYNRTGYTTACASVCASPGALTNGSCLGVGCCQNAIPQGLTRYDVSFHPVYNDTNSSLFNPCSYAVMVETEAFSFSSAYITTKMFNETYKGRQPLVLDWAIGNVSCKVAENMPSYACRGVNHKCVDSTNGPGYLCNCSDGYEGNPYLHDGCTGEFVSLCTIYLQSS